MIEVSYKGSVLTDSEVEEIKSLLKTDQVIFHKQEVGKVHNYVGEEVIAYLYSDIDIKTLIVGNSTWEVLKLTALTAWDYLKNRRNIIYTSGGNSRTLTEIEYQMHFIKVVFKLSDKYYQHFLISNKLERMVLDDKFVDMLKASEKYLTKWEQLEIRPEYTVDEVRLTKKGKWKRINSQQKFQKKSKKYQVRKTITL